MANHESEDKECPTITISYLTEKQMREVRKYLGKPSNKVHYVKSKWSDFKHEFGPYVSVSVGGVDSSVDETTARHSVHGYNDVTFTLPYQSPHVATDLQKGKMVDNRNVSERKEVVKGLVSLLGSFLTDKK